MIRFSLLYLLKGFTIGAAILISKAWPVYSEVWMLLSVHIELLIFGFIIQFTMGTSEEFIHQHEVADHVAAGVFEQEGESVEYKVGTMIEIPRAAIVADKIAEEAEFFSFGTNDLTQMPFGYSRDDAGKFLEVYMREGILENDPFQVLDTVLTICMDHS